MFENLLCCLQNPILRHPDSCLKMHQLLKIVLPLALLPCLASSLSREAAPQEQLLDIFFGSKRRLADALPKKNLTDSIPLRINFAFIITHVFDIKSDEEQLDLGIWVAMRWTNELVSWNQTEYPVEYLEVPASKVWIPSVYLQENAISTVLKPSEDAAVVIVQSNGFTLLDFGIRIKVSCSMPACLFPMDNHVCPLHMVSTTQNTKNLVLVYDEETRKNYEGFEARSPGLWHVKVQRLVDKSRDIFVSKGIKRRTSILGTNILLKHKPEFFWITILAPIALICVVTFCAVLLPRESGERTSLLITCFLAQIVYLDSVLKSVPKTSDYVPLLVLFLFVVLTFTAGQIMLTAVTSYYAERANKGQVLSPWHKTFVAFISNICMIRKRKNNHVKSLKEDSFYQNEVELRKRPSLSSDSFQPNANTNLGVADNPQTEEVVDSEEQQDEAIGKPKVCKGMCKAVDRISMLASFILLIATPIVFRLMYDGTITYDCSTKTKKI